MKQAVLSTIGLLFTNTSALTAPYDKMAETRETVCTALEKQFAKSTQQDVSRDFFISDKLQTLTYTQDAYTQLICEGIISYEQYDKEASKKIGAVSQSLGQGDDQFQKLVRSFKQTVKNEDGNTLEKRLNAVSVVLKELNKHVSYMADSHTGVLGVQTTPYMRLVRDIYVEIYKTPSVFLIDGGGDCDDYALCASAMLQACDIDAHMIHLIYPNVCSQNHAVIAVEIPQYTQKTFTELIEAYRWDLFEKSIFTQTQTSYISYNTDANWNESTNNGIIVFDFEDKTYLAIEPQRVATGFLNTTGPVQADCSIKLYHNKSGTLHEPEVTLWTPIQMSKLKCTNQKMSYSWFDPQNKEEGFYETFMKRHKE